MVKKKIVKKAKELKKGDKFIWSHKIEEVIFIRTNAFKNIVVTTKDNEGILFHPDSKLELE